MGLRSPRDEKVTFFFVLLLTRRGSSVSWTQRPQLWGMGRRLLFVPSTKCPGFLHLPARTWPSPPRRVDRTRELIAFEQPPCAKFTPAPPAREPATGNLWNFAPHVSGRIQRACTFKRRASKGLARYMAKIHRADAEGVAGEAARGRRAGDPPRTPIDQVIRRRDRSVERMASGSSLCLRALNSATAAGPWMRSKHFGARSVSLA